MEWKRTSQNQKPVQSYGEEEVCPVCGGSGWELVQRPEEFYGGAMTDFARKCTRCSGKMRSRDFTKVPSQFRDADIGRFDFEIYSANMEKIKRLSMSIVNDFEKWMQFGKGLFLWSKTPGSGKTMLSCSIAKSVMMKYDLQMRFITAPDYISLVGESYKRERGEIDKSEVFKKCKVLILDDIGAQQGNEWQQKELFTLIDERMSERNVTFYTSNMPPEKLNLEDRTKDRILKSCVTIQMPEESIRARKAAEEQQHFLSEVVGI